MGNQDYMDEKAAAEYLGLSVSWLKKNRLASTRGPKVRVTRISARKLKYKRTDLDAFLDARNAGVEQIEMF
jgi:hypothetical protein